MMNFDIKAAKNYNGGSLCGVENSLDRVVLDISSNEIVRLQVDIDKS